MIGGELRHNIGTFHGSTLGIVIGVLGTIYGGTGVMQAAQASFNRIYGVPRNEEPNVFRSRVRSLALLALLGTGLLLSTAITIALATADGLFRELGQVLHVLGYVLSFLLALALFTGAFQLLTARTLRLRQVLRGGLLAAAWWELLQIAGAAYVAHEIKHANQLYGTFALVLGAIGWIYLQAIGLLLAAETNAVLEFRLWPRALLTPFTDAVTLTHADRRAYSLYAGTERFKGFERVEAHFPSDASADDVPGQARPRELPSNDGARARSDTTG